MDNDESIFGTLHIFNSATCAPIIDIHWYLKVNKKIDSHLLQVEQSDTKFSVHKKVHTIHMSKYMAYYFIDETGDTLLEKASISIYV